MLFFFAPRLQDNKFFLLKDKKDKKDKKNYE